MELIELIKKLQSEKERDKIHPTHVMYKDLRSIAGNDISGELNAFYKAGKIIVGRTLNDKYIKIKE